MHKIKSIKLYVYCGTVLHRISKFLIFCVLCLFQMGWSWNKQLRFDGNDLNRIRTQNDYDVAKSSLNLNLRKWSWCKWKNDQLKNKYKIYTYYMYTHVCVTWLSNKYDVMQDASLAFIHRTEQHVYFHFGYTFDAYKLLLSKSNLGEYIQNLFDLCSEFAFGMNLKIVSITVTPKRWRRENPF